MVTVNLWTSDDASLLLGCNLSGLPSVPRFQHGSPHSYEWFTIPKDILLLTNTRSPQSLSQERITLTPWLRYTSTSGLLPSLGRLACTLLANVVIAV